MAYTNEELKQRYPSLRKELTVAHPEIAADAPLVVAFTRAMDAVGVDVKTSNKALGIIVEELNALQKK